MKLKGERENKFRHRGRVNVAQQIKPTRQTVYTVAVLP